MKILLSVLSVLLVLSLSGCQSEIPDSAEQGASSVPSASESFTSSEEVSTIGQDLSGYTYRNEYDHLVQYDPDGTALDITAKTNVPCGSDQFEIIVYRDRVYFFDDHEQLASCAADGEDMVTTLIKPFRFCVGADLIFMAPDNDRVVGFPITELVPEATQEDLTLTVYREAGWSEGVTADHKGKLNPAVRSLCFSQDYLYYQLTMTDSNLKYWAYSIWCIRPDGSEKQELCTGEEIHDIDDPDPMERGYYMSDRLFESYKDDFVYISAYDHDIPQWGVLKIDGTELTHIPAVAENEYSGSAANELLHELIGY